MSTCQWRVYTLKDDAAFERWFKGSLDECFEIMDCTNSATQDFAWSTDHLRQVYGGDTTPVCDDHLKNFELSNQVSLWVQKSVSGELV